MSTGQTTLSKYSKLKTVAAAGLLIFLIVSFAYPQSNTQPSKEEKARKRELKQEAALNLWRLKKSIENDEFYAARVALNVWRSNAIDAGTFDQAQYDEFKQQLYEKSVSRSLACFEYFLTEQYFHDANMCLQTWKVNSQEIGLFDEERYKALKERLKDARAKKAEEDKKKSENENKGQ
jgi:hypothetical protein